jgi:hypothetical protein
MSQTGYTPILLYGSTTTGNVPLAANLTTSASGVELAINAFDGKLFYKDASGNVQVLAGKGGTGVVAGSNTQIQFNNNGVFGASSSLTWDGTYLTAGSIKDSALTSGRVTYAGTSGLLQDSTNLTFDGTTLTAGGFATGGSVTLSGGTANGVLYLNGSKVATSGSALTFDGTRLQVSNTAPALYLTDSTPTSGVNFGLFNGGASYSYGQIGLRDLTNSQTAYTYFSGASGYHNWFQNGSESMRLTSTGLGIGASSPLGKLDVRGTAYFNGTGATSSASQLMAAFGASGGSYFGQLINAGSTWSLGYGASYSSVGTSVLTWDSSGNLGIGTSSPTYKVDVSVTTNNGIRTTSSAGQQSYLGNTGGEAVVGTLNNYGFAIITNGSIRGYFDTSGNLGLGVTPSAWYSANKALDIGTRTALWSGGAGQPNLGYNCYVNTSGNFIYKASDAANYYSQDGAHKWFNAASGTAGDAISFTQAMTLDASGNLKLGTTSGSSAVRMTINSGTFASIWSINDTTLGYSQFYFGGDYNTGYQFIRADGRSNGYVAFGTADTERARIDSSGNLLVGTTSTISAFNNKYRQVINPYTNSSSQYGLMVSANANAYTQYAMLFADTYSEQVVGTITFTTSATAYNTSSDYRLKDNPQPLTGSGAFIDALKPKTWSWKADGSKGVGFIAHEVQEVSPNSVVGEKDGEQMQAMEYGSAEFIANIIAELQSLRKRLADAGIA